MGALSPQKSSFEPDYSQVPPSMIPQQDLPPPDYSQVPPSMIPQQDTPPPASKRVLNTLGTNMATGVAQAGTTASRLIANATSIYAPEGYVKE